jgi:hypothetical protein
MTTTNEARETIAISASNALVEVCVANKGPPNATVQNAPSRCFFILFQRALDNFETLKL